MPVTAADSNLCFSGDAQTPRNLQINCVRLKTFLLALRTQGLTASAGAQGFQGAQGAQGTSGNAGTAGNRGVQGAQGAQGPVGTP